MAVTHPHVRFLGWFGAITGVLGTLLLASNTTWSSGTFLFWWLSNIAWILHSHKTQIWAQGAMQLGYLVVTLIGVFQHFGWEIGVLLGVISIVIGGRARILHAPQSVSVEEASWLITRLGWVGAVTGLGAALLFALDLPGARWGLLLWVVSNSAWMIHARNTGIHAQYWMQFSYFALNILAMYRYFNAEAALALAAYLALFTFFLARHPRRPIPA